MNALFKQCIIRQNFRNLIGLIISTNFRCGIGSKTSYAQETIFAGNEIWLVRNKLDTKRGVEEGASIRAVKKRYVELAGLSSAPIPKEIFEIGMGIRSGDQKAAKKSYQLLGEVVGNVIVNTLTLIDGLVVIGGGLVKSSSFVFSSSAERIE